MEQSIKPIETHYNGLRFRSRLEARWAVFFDALGIRYLYEPEGFENADGDRYLPDFYLPNFNTYVEVKADRDGNEADILRMARMIEPNGQLRRIVILSNIPGESDDGGLWHFPVLYYDGRFDEVAAAWGFFSDYNKFSVSHAAYMPPFRVYQNHKNEYIPIAAKTDKSMKTSGFEAYITDETGEEMLSVNGCKRDINELCKYLNAHGIEAWCADLTQDARIMNPETFNAFKTARQARFEHGETPQIRR